MSAIAFLFIFKPNQQWDKFVCGHLPARLRSICDLPFVEEQVQKQKKELLYKIGCKFPDFYTKLSHRARLACNLNVCLLEIC